MPSSRGTVLSAIALASLASSLPTSVDVPEGCAAGVHIIAAYGTEVPQAAVAGFQGLASQVSGQLGGQSSDVCYDADWSGSTDSTINWQASATWKAYTSSEMSATSSMTQEIIAYAQKCPTTKIVLLGYSMVWLLSPIIRSTLLTYLLGSSSRHGHSLRNFSRRIQCYRIP